MTSLYSSLRYLLLAAFLVASSTTLALSPSDLDLSELTDEEWQKALVFSEFSSRTELVSAINAALELMQSNHLPDQLSPLQQLLNLYGAQFLLVEDRLVNLWIRYYVRLHENELGLPNELPTAALQQSFLQLADFQINDNESPFSLAPFKRLIGSAYRANNPHILFQVDALMRWLPRFYDEQDFSPKIAAFSGDLADIGQFNEVRWGITSLSGGYVNPDSGADDNAIPNTLPLHANDSYDDYITPGLTDRVGNKLPWYFIRGNHDGLGWGNIPLSDEPIRLLGLEFASGTQGFFNDITTGSRLILGYNPGFGDFVKFLVSGNKQVPADADRYVLNVEELHDEFFISNGMPYGHGLALAENNKYRYQFYSANGKIRHLVFDSNMGVGPQGAITDEDLLWIEERLMAAQVAGELVVLHSHHKAQDIWGRGKRFKNLLLSYTNVIAHLVGHSHHNRIKEVLGQGNGYWEIATSAMVNWPQEIRAVSVYFDEQTGVGAIKTWMLIYRSDSPVSMAERGRFLAYLESLLGSGGESSGLSGREGGLEDRNRWLPLRRMGDKPIITPFQL